MSIQAMKQALEALGYGYDAARCTAAVETIRNAESALSAAIEAAEKQEPVAWMGEYNINDIRDHYTVVMRHKTDFSSMPDRVRPLYTHPQPAIPEGWQPIETAPKDCSDFLAYNPMTRKHVVVFWKHDAWIFPELVFSSSITHWMPLPAAPKPENSHD